MKLQDPKYQFLPGAVQNRHSGELIPNDEPVFVFRARDKHAAAVLRFYDQLIEDTDHGHAVCARIEDFDRFAAEHPERMKEPDTAAGRAALEQG